jgi:hypothetical protein
MQRAWLRFRDLPAVGLAVVLIALSACGDDDEPSKSNSKDAGTEKDAAVPGTRIPTGGRSGSGGGGGTGGGSVSSSAYTCQPKRGDTGGPSESGAECCGGMGLCTGAGDTSAGLPHETCKAQPDLRCVPKPRTPDEDAGISAAGFTRGRPELRRALHGELLRPGQPDRESLVAVDLRGGRALRALLQPAVGQSDGHL